MRTIEKRQEMKPIEMKLARRLGGVGEYYFSKKLREIDRMRASGRQIINLGIGSPDRPPHPDVIGTLAAEAAKPGNHGYQPYKGAAVLREAFALWYKERYGVALDPEGEILPLIGSKEGVMHVCMTYLDEGDRVLVPNPGYPTYRSAVTIAGGVCVDYVLREDGGWMPDFDEIERGGLQGVKMMIVNYPHMPTGAAPKEGLFRRLVDFARRHGILLLHDNPYSFLRNDRPESLLATPGATEVALELNSLSKSHCMAGWRIGMIGGARERIDEIIRFKLILWLSDQIILWLTRKPCRWSTTGIGSSMRCTAAARPRLTRYSTRSAAPTIPFRRGCSFGDGSPREPETAMSFRTGY